MAGTSSDLTTSFSPGQICILYVDDVNTPTGWWFGVVDTVVQHGSWADISAHITGPFMLDKSWKPIYGNQKELPFQNYAVYPDTPSMRSVIWQLLKDLRAEQDSAKNLATRLNELRTLIQAAMKVDVDKLLAAIKAMK